MLFFVSLIAWKKVGMIVDAASLVVVYVDPDYDLTNDVLAALVRGDD